MPAIDAGRVSVAGHSRLGKTALWCAAQDERFSSVIANNSGFAGAALASRGHGEKVSDFIRCGSSDWFCPRFQSYLGRENELPFDQHDVLALIAPRRICVGSAALDIGADPPSEFLSCLAASDVYRLLGRSGLITPDRFPEPGTVLHEGEIGYHIRRAPLFSSATGWPLTCLTLGTYNTKTSWLPSRRYWPDRQEGCCPLYDRTMTKNRQHNRDRSDRDPDMRSPR
jgi:hypothetical protein